MEEEKKLLLIEIEVKANEGKEDGRGRQGTWIEWNGMEKNERIWANMNGISMSA